MSFWKHRKLWLELFFEKEIVYTPLTWGVTIIQRMMNVLFGSDIQQIVEDSAENVI